jgi:hypothetical protein
MGEIVNLRRARKAKVRAQSVQAAVESRTRHGRTKEQREAEERDAARTVQRHEGHRLEDGDSD